MRRHTNQKLMVFTITTPRLNGERTPTCSPLSLELLPICEECGDLIEEGQDDYFAESRICTDCATSASIVICQPVFECGSIVTLSSNRRGYLYQIMEELGSQVKVRKFGKDKITLWCSRSEVQVLSNTELLLYSKTVQESCDPSLILELLKVADVFSAEESTEIGEASLGEVICQAYLDGVR